MFDSLFSQSGLSLDRLRSLVEVDQAGSIVGASPDDPIRQSQISRNLGQLESFFGLELKRRKGKGIELTAEGKRLATLARAQLLSMEDFLGEATAKPIELRIGAGQSTLEWVLIPRLAKLADSGNSPHFTLETARSHEVVQRLNQFSLDLGIVRKSAITTKRIQSRPIGTVRYALFAHASVVREFGDDPLKLLRSLPLATAMGGEYRGKFDAFMAEHSITPNLRYSCSSFRTVLEIMKGSSQVVAILPDAGMAELDPKRFVALDLPFLKAYQRDLVLAWHERIVDLRPGVKGFIDSITESSKGMD